MNRPDKDYHCEDCSKFDEAEVPSNCLSGHGKVAFMRRVCPDFVLRVPPAESNETGLEE
jgi:hypothetical protein